jgi:hypothetical protein
MNESIIATFSIPFALILREIMEWHAERTTDKTSWMMVLCCSILTFALLFIQIFQNDQHLETETYFWSLLAGFFYAS